MTPTHDSPATQHEQASFRMFLGWLGLLLFVTDVVCARLGQLELAPEWYYLVCTGLGLLWLLRLRQRPLSRLTLSGELAAWSLIYLHLLSILIQNAGRTPAGLVDRQLAAVDAFAHVSTAGIVHWVGLHPLLQRALNGSYMSSTGLIVLTALLLPLLGRERQARRFVLSIILAVMLTAAVFAFLPAVGPWTTSDLQPTEHQRAVQHYLMLLKTTGGVSVNMKDSAIVAFPSFHTVMALVIAIAFHSMRWVRTATWLMAVVVVAATVTTGWHYVTDVVGGVLVCIAATLASEQVLRALALKPSPADPKVRS